MVIDDTIEPRAPSFEKMVFFYRTKYSVRLHAKNTDGIFGTRKRLVFRSHSENKAKSLHLLLQNEVSNVCKLLLLHKKEENFLYQKYTNVKNKIFLYFT